MKGTNWEGGTRVPFIIRGDGVPENEMISVPAWSPDVFPTLLEVLEIDVPEGLFLDGESIVEVIKGNKTDHGPIFTLLRDEVMTIRHNEWKLFLDEPRYFSGISESYLESWEARSPDGETILAPTEQYYPPESYPGIEPEEKYDFPVLFSLQDDPGETKTLRMQIHKKCRN